MQTHGWVLDRIKGSHHIMIKEGLRSIPIPIPVPVHGKTDMGIWAEKILRQAGIK